MTGVEMMLKSFGFDPKKMLELVQQFQAIMQGILIRLESIEQLQHQIIETQKHQTAVLAQLSAGTLMVEIPTDARSH